MDYRKLVFRHISRHVLLIIFSRNLDLLENISSVSAKNIHTQAHELFNCAKIKGAKINCAKIRSTSNLFCEIKVSVLQLFASQVVTT